MLSHVSIVVSGKVQGVFFRASTERKAIELGVKGFVKNQPDGSVYIEAEATEEILEAFIKWCHHGPPAAKVHTCTVKKGEAKNFREFTIVR